MKQTYFSKEEVAEIASHIMGFQHGLLKVKKDNATLALRAIKLLEDRLEDKKILKLIYTREEISPKPIQRFVQSYIKGEQPEAKKILQYLQEDMKEFFHADGTKFGDISELPSAVLSDTEGLLIPKLKYILTQVLEKYNSKTTAQELIDEAQKDLNDVVNLNVLAEGLADIISKNQYSYIIARVGGRDPTREELAGNYLKALNKAYQLLTVDPNKYVQKEKVIEQRRKLYAQEIKEFQNFRDGLFL